MTDFIKTRLRLCFSRMCSDDLRRMLAERDTSRFTAESFELASEILAERASQPGHEADCRTDGSRLYGGTGRRRLRAMAFVAAVPCAIAGVLVAFQPKHFTLALWVAYCFYVNPILIGLIARNYAKGVNRDYDARMAESHGTLYWLFHGIPGEAHRGPLAFARGAVFSGFAAGSLLVIGLFCKLFGVTNWL